MTEDEARDWIAAHHGAAATDRVAQFLTMVITENSEQNLVAPSTIDALWARHAVDSAQLVPMARDGLWIDIGTGGGFPGMIVAILRDQPTVLVEPRKRRAAFLDEAATALALSNVRVVAAKVESIRDKAATISARAVAPLEKLLQIAAGCAKKETRWLLPRGRLAMDDLAELRERWHGMFHVEQSLTDPASSILTIEGLVRR